MWWGGGKDSVIFKGVATGTLTMLQHKLDLVYFCFVLFLQGDTGWGVYLGVMGIECDWDAV